MGLDLPPEFPELDPAILYRVWVAVYDGTCEDTQIGIGFCAKTGAQINAWYDAESQCKVGESICGINPAHSELITLIEIP